MKSRFLDALTHSGPGYELPHEVMRDQPRSNISRFLDALTHSGPGYELSSPSEAVELSRLKREKMKAVYDLLLESLELYLYAAGNLEAASRSSQSEDREKLLRSAAERLQAYLQITGQPMEIALNGARESHGPLNMLTKINLRRLSRLMDRSRAGVKSTLDATTPPAQHIEHIPKGSQTTVKQASRSIEVICHAVAR